MAVDDLDLDDEIEESGADKKGKKPKKEKKPKKPKEPKPPKPPKAPKEPKPPKEKKEKGESAGNIGKIFLGLLFWLFIGGIAALLFFNVLGIRQNYVIPQLRKVPVVRNIIPVLEGEKVEVVDTSNPDSALSKNQLLDKIKILEKQIEDMTKDSTTKDEHIKSIEDQLVNLQKYKEEQDAFTKEKSDFDAMIANNDPNAYSAFYAQIYPENAEKIYTEIVKKTQLDAETKKYTATFQDMKPGPAAKLLEEMIRTDVNRVVFILENVDSKQRAAILAQMQPRNAAVITKRLVPVNSP